jgi:hypothetical protein
MLIAKWKKPVWKVYILYESNWKTFWKTQTYENSKKIKVPTEGGRKEQVEPIGFLWQWNYSVIMNVCHNNFLNLIDLQNVKSEP